MAAGARYGGVHAARSTMPRYLRRSSASLLTKIQYTSLCQTMSDVRKCQLGRHRPVQPAAPSIGSTDLDVETRSKKAIKSIYAPLLAFPYLHYEF